MKAQEYLLEKGIRKVHQPKKRYNLSIEELVMFLEEFAAREKEKLMRPAGNKLFQKFS
jgi:hypothetical protein